MSVKTVVSCDSCGSNDVEIEERYTDEKYKTVKDSSLDWSRTVCISAKISLECTCKKCGEHFTEDGGNYIRNRQSDEYYT